MLIPLELKALGYVAAVLGICGALYAAQQHERHLGGLECEAKNSARYAADVATADAQTAQINSDREAAHREADKFRLQAIADRAGAPVADRGLRDAAGAFLGRCLPAHPAVAGVSEAASSAADLSAELRRGIESAQRDARDLAGFATAAHAAGGECVGAYPVK